MAAVRSSAAVVSWNLSQARKNRELTTENWELATENRELAAENWELIFLRPSVPTVVNSGLQA